jgi:hypothetical protein
MNSDHAGCGAPWSLSWWQVLHPRSALLEHWAVVEASVDRPINNKGIIDFVVVDPLPNAGCACEVG